MGHPVQSFLNRRSSSSNSSRSRSRSRERRKRREARGGRGAGGGGGGGRASSKSSSASSRSRSSSPNDIPRRIKQVRVVVQGDPSPRGLVGFSWIWDVPLSCLGSTAAAVQPSGLWNIPNRSQPIPGPRGDGSPCIVKKFFLDRSGNTTRC